MNDKHVKEFETNIQFYKKGLANMDTDLKDSLAEQHNANLKAYFWDRFMEMFNQLDRQGQTHGKLKMNFFIVNELVKQIEGLGIRIWHDENYTYFDWGNAF